VTRRTVRTNLTPTRRERRDPIAATQPLRFISPGYPQTDRWNAHTAVTRAYLANFVVARCIQIKAQDLAALPFLAGPRLPVDHTERPESNPNARLRQLLGIAPVPPNARKAVDGLSAAVFWEWMLTQRYLTGKMAAEIEWSGATFTSEIAALWPLPSAEVRPVATSGGAQWFSEFHVGPPTSRQRQKILKPGQIFYKWDPAPDDFRQPYSVLESAGIDVNVAIMVGRYNHAFLRNDARPAAVVVTEAFATDEDAEAFQNQFEGRHQGVDNAGKIAFVETDPDGALPGQAVRIETLGLTQKDARMLEMHRASLEHVAMALGVPWSRLSAADRTFSNAGQESVDYWKSLAGDARKIAGEVNASLAPLLGAEVGWFDLSGVEALAPRPPVSAGEAAILVRDGIATADEVRPWYGLSGPGPEMPALPAAPTQCGR
jgi:HK97 family phage portal protein